MTLKRKLSIGNLANFVYLLVRQRGLSIGRDTAVAGFEVDAQAVQQADTAAAMGATGLGVAGLHAMDMLGGAVQAFTPCLRPQGGGLD